MPAGKFLKECVRFRSVIFQNCPCHNFLGSSPKHVATNRSANMPKLRFLKCLWKQGCGVGVGTGVWSRSESAVLVGVGAGVCTVLPTLIRDWSCKLCPINRRQFWPKGYLVMMRFDEIHKQNESSSTCVTFEGHFATQFWQTNDIKSTFKIIRSWCQLNSFCHTDAFNRANIKARRAGKP